MKRFLFALLTAGAGAVISLQAASYSSGCCDPCPSWCCGSFEVGGQAIYLRPTSCDFEYVIVDDRPFVDSTVHQAILPQTKAKNVDPDYEWGFRVSVGYITQCCCNDVRVEYTYLHTHDKSTVGPFVAGGKGIWPVIPHPRYMTDESGNGLLNSPWYTMVNGDIQASAFSKLKFDYDAVDLQFGSRSLKGCNLWLRTYAGLHFMNLDHKQVAHYQGSPDPDATASIPFQFSDVTATKNTWGIGPLFGLDARYVIACGFGIGGHIGAAVLAGETSGRLVDHEQRFTDDTSNVDLDETLNVKHGDRNILFPYIRASLGINYLWCCGNCFNVLVEFGYEFNSYINTIGQFRFNDQRGTGMANCYSFNLDGLYLSVRATI